MRRETDNTDRLVMEVKTIPNRLTDIYVTITEVSASEDFKHIDKHHLNNLPINSAQLIEFTSMVHFTAQTDSRIRSNLIQG